MNLSGKSTELGQRARRSCERHRAFSSHGRWVEVEGGPLQGKAKGVTHEEAISLTLMYILKAPPTLTLKGGHQHPWLGRAEDPSSHSPSHNAGIVLGAEFPVM